MHESDDRFETEEQLARREAVRARFMERGVAIAWWASELGYPRSLVYAVLGGRIAGRRGLAHQIAVDLGIKPGPRRLGDSDPLNRLDAVLARAQHCRIQEGHSM